MKKVPRKRITISLPEPLLQRFREYAVLRRQSMSSLLANAMRRIIDEAGENERANKRFLKRIHNAPGRSQRGVIDWGRDELYERVRDE